VSKIKINETTLPGVGLRHNFKTESDNHLGVLHHHSGRLDLLIYDRFDPDSCQRAIALSEDEGRVLGELLGASQITRSVDNLQQNIGGLTIDWITIVDSWLCNATTINQLKLNDTGVLIVAVIRDGTTTPIPKSDFQLLSGDTVIVIGTSEGIQSAYEIMQGT
jgi:TrkA domain protein